MQNALQAENELLRRQLQALLDEARLNEKKWHRFEQVEKQLIATHTLTDLFQAILQDYKSAFDTDVVTLVLLDPEYEIARTLEREKRGNSKLSGLVLLESLESGDIQPYLGPFDTEQKRAIFDPWPSGCQSMILLPLMRQGELIGSLNMSSCMSERFTADRSTDFLERLAAVFAICLENSLNHERLKLVGLTDPLTGVYNRRYFETRCHEEVAGARRHRLPLACMFLDIDKFKRINDTLGHLAGDEVLRIVASLIKSQLRNNDVIARYGGEEFVVLLPQTTLPQACEIAERVRFVMAAQPLRPLPGQSLEVTISIGVAVTQEELAGDDRGIANSLLEVADQALYQAKESGRNRVVSAEDELLCGTGAKRRLIGQAAV